MERHQLEANIREILDRVTIHPRVYERAAKQLERVAEAEALTRADQARSIERALLLVESKICTVVDMRVDGLIDDAEMRERREVLLRERQSLLVQQASFTNTERRIEPLRSLNLAISCLASWFSAGSDRLKRKILQLVGSNPSLLEKKLRIDLAFPVYATNGLHQLPALSARQGSVTHNFFEKNLRYPASRRRAPAFDPRRKLSHSFLRYSFVITQSARQGSNLRPIA